MTDNTNCQDIAPQNLNDSKIEKLIAELCPEGVEVKELGEVAKYSKQRVAATVLNDENYVGVDNLLPNKQGKTKSSYVPTTGNLTRFESGDVLLGNIRPYLKKIWLASHAGGTNGDVLAIQINNKKMLQSEFLYYLLSSDDFFRFDVQFAKGAKMPRGNKCEIMRYIVPIPPLAIQHEIVKILDTFITLEAELEAELEARKQQYAHYRDELLTFEDDVEWKTLSEVAHFMNGKGHEKHIDENGSYIVVNSKFVSTEGRVKKYSGKQISPVSENDILMVMSDLPNGKALAKCFYVDENDKYTLNQRICALTSKSNNALKPMFLFYVLNRNKQLLRYDSGADQTNLRKDDILKIKIPIPPLAEQERIVAILDKFDALVNDISVGLPAELNARHKQYEYYREKLLTFESL